MGTLECRGKRLEYCHQANGNFEGEPSVRQKKNCKLKIKCDNQAVFWILKRGRSFCWELNNLVRRIGGDLHSRGIWLEVDWIKSEDNLADGISRSWNKMEANSNQQAFLASGKLAEFSF